jgi:hypothetical protein
VKKLLFMLDVISLRQAHQGMSQNAYICTSSAAVLYLFCHDHSAFTGVLIFLFSHLCLAVPFNGFEDSFLNKKNL